MSLKEAFHSTPSPQAPEGKVAVAAKFLNSYLESPENKKKQPSFFAILERCMKRLLLYEFVVVMMMLPGRNS